MNNIGVYKILNKTNNKVYVGSSINITKRKYVHFNKLSNNKHKNIKLQNAYNKYGKNSFLFKIIEYVEDKNLLLVREQYWIEYFNSVENGYNICKFAGHTLGYKHTKEAKKKISDFLKTRTVTDKTKRKISKANKGRLLGKNHPNYGKSLKKEVKEKISEANSGNKNGMFGSIIPELQKDIMKKLAIKSRSKQVQCIETRKIYNSITEASKLTGTNRRHISDVCKGKRKTSGGYTWRYYED